MQNYICGRALNNSSLKHETGLEESFGWIWSNFQVGFAAELQRVRFLITRDFQSIFGIRELSKVNVVSIEVVSFYSLFDFGS